MTFNLISPLPVRECVRRLRAATDGEWAMAGSKTVLGWVGEKSLRLRKRTYYRNSSQVWLSGKFAEENGHTRLRCTAGLHPFVRTFLEYWVAAVLLGGGLIFFRTAKELLGGYILSPHLSPLAPLPPNLWLGIIVPPVLLGFGIILLIFGDYPSSDEPRFLIEFVARTIEAREER
jgi:hypothetical protein